MPISKTQLKKFRVKELRECMKRNKIKGRSGNKSSLIEKISNSNEWERISKEMVLPEKKKRVFSEKQLVNQQRFKEQHTKKKLPRDTMDTPEDLTDKEVEKRDKEVKEIQKIDKIKLIKKDTISSPIETKKCPKGKKKCNCGDCFNKQDSLLARVIREAYGKRTTRKKKIDGLKYMKGLSSNLFAHYEDDKRVVIGIHGADDVKLNILEINTYFDKNFNSRILKRVCKKFDSLLTEQRRVIVGGHSIGGFAINTCVDKQDYPFSFTSFGSYTPNKNRKWSRNRVRKHLYESDWLSNNLLETNNNCLIYKSNVINSHSLANFLDKKQMNKDIIKDNSEKVFLENLETENGNLRKLVKMLKRQNNKD